MCTYQPILRSYITTKRLKRTNSHVLHMSRFEHLGLLPTCRWQPSTMMSFCCGEVLAKTISVWYFRMSSSCSGLRSFRSPPCTTQALASLEGRRTHQVTRNLYHSIPGMLKPFLKQTGTENTTLRYAACRYLQLFCVFDHYIPVIYL